MVFICFSFYSFETQSNEEIIRQIKVFNWLAVFEEQIDCCRRWRHDTVYDQFESAPKLWNHESLRLFFCLEGATVGTQNSMPLLDGWPACIHSRIITNFNNFKKVTSMLPFADKKKRDMKRWNIIWNCFPFLRSIILFFVFCASRFLITLEIHRRSIWGFVVSLFRNDVGSVCFHPSGGRSRSKLRRIAWKSLKFFVIINKVLIKISYFFRKNKQKFKLFHLKPQKNSHISYLSHPVVHHYIFFCLFSSSKKQNQLEKRDRK